MDLNHRLNLSYYKTIATINEAHNIFLVQHQTSNRIFIKKILDVYNIDVYNKLYSHPIPGTPRIIDFCEEDNKLLLIEEYISGTPLCDKLADNSLTESDVLSYTMDLCNILEELHSLKPPVIHRDIKPSNIIITNYNHAVLLDFNAAKQFSAEELKDTVLLGTKGYAAPEQYGFGSSSPQTDIYSLGIVLKELLSACNSASDELKQIAEKCTRLSPGERYSSIIELKIALHPHIKQSREKSPHIRYTLQRFLPPGFRTHTPWKMFFSSVVYFFCIWLFVSIRIENAQGPVLWLYRLFYLAMMLSVVFGSFNYLNIQKLCPLCQHKKPFVRYLGIVILDLVLFFSIMMLMILTETLISNL